MKKSDALSPAIEKILRLARWAPSGDNAQPWSFDLVDDNHIILKVTHQPGNVYEYREGEPTLISVGALLENIDIAARSAGQKLVWKLLPKIEEGGHRISLAFEDEIPHPDDRLVTEIEKRTVDRRPYRLKKLTENQKSHLGEALRPGLSLRWYEGVSERLMLARLCSSATDIRLRIPETFQIHNEVVDWDRDLSPTGIPAKALGLDALTLKLMRWSMRRRSRTELANRLGSPFFASLQMDILPGLFSSGYFSFSIQNREKNPETAILQILDVGRSLQRFWLTASRLGLVIQPCVAVLAFAHYGAAGVPFTVMERSQQAAAALAIRARELLGSPNQVVFLGRIGSPRSPIVSRSVRRALPDFLN